MAYIGNVPAEKYIALTQQTFSSPTGTSFTLSQAVTNSVDIDLYIDNVKQDPASYSVSGTALTTSTIASPSTMYCIFNGKAMQTVNPPDGSVGTAKVTDDAITLAKLAPGTDGNIISFDASGNTVAIATGNDGQVLTSTGAGSPPAFETAAAGGKLLQMAHTTASFSGTAVHATSNTWTDSNVLITFTPVSTASKFVVNYSMGAAITSDADDGGYGYRIKKVQGGTTSYPTRLGDYNHSGSNAHSRRYFYSSNVSSLNNWFSHDVGCGVDADSHTTGSLTYTIQCAQVNLTDKLVVGTIAQSQAQMVVMEIAN